MKKLILLPLLLFGVFFSQVAFAQEESTASVQTFEEGLERNQMEFTIPVGLIETTPIENQQMSYGKAYRHPSERFEVRYAIRSHEYNFFKQIFMTTVLNISGGQLPEFDTFKPEAVKKEFNADAGATVLTTLGEEFGQEYQFCLFVYIHKDGVGDGYIFYLADEQEKILELMTPHFYTLKFKKEE